MRNPKYVKELEHFYVEKTRFEDLIIIRPKIYEDERGFFLELLRLNEIREVIGSNCDFVQSMHAHSRKNVIRGMHAEQFGKLFYIVSGHLFSAISDVRPNSLTFGKTITFEFNDKNRFLLYLPLGFANGYCALSETADVIYWVTDYYKGKEKRAIAWNDPDLAIPWPVSKPILSEADKRNPNLRMLFPEKFK